MRLEILTGVDVSDNVTVNVPNSIDYRLTRLIVYLEGKHPDQGCLYSSGMENRIGRESPLGARRRVRVSRR